MSLRLPKCFPAPHWLPPASWSLDSILENVHFAADSDPHSGPHCPSGVPSPASWNLEGGSSAALPNLNSALRRDVLPSRVARLHVEQGAARPRHAEGAAPNVRGAADKPPVQRLAELHVERLRPGPVGAVGACSQQTGAWRGAPRLWPPGRGAGTTPWCRRTTESRGAPHRSPQRPFLVASAPTTGPRTRRGSRWGLQGTVFWFHGRPCLLAGLSP